MYLQLATDVRLSVIPLFHHPPQLSFLPQGENLLQISKFVHNEHHRILQQ